MYENMKTFPQYWSFERLIFRSWVDSPSQRASIEDILCFICFILNNTPWVKKVIKEISYVNL